MPQNHQITKIHNLFTIQYRQKKNYIIILGLFVASHLWGIPNNLGIGLGAYPGGCLSFRYFFPPNVMVQFTQGVPFWHIYWTGREAIAIGVRGAHKIGTLGEYYKFLQSIGIGLNLYVYGTHSSEGVPEVFYELECFPEPLSEGIKSVFKISTSSQISLAISVEAYYVGRYTSPSGIYFPILSPAIHFYF